MTSGPAYYYKEIKNALGTGTEFAVMDWTGRCVTTKLTEAAAQDAVDSLYQRLRNYGDAVAAGLDPEDI